jgi:gamma-glutamyltranspeptidase/glutathione hydrolase
VPPPPPPPPAGNGAAPAALTLEAVAAAGITSQLPTRSALCATVPGAVAFWEDAVKHWGSGTKTLAEILAPAIELAEQGFPVSPVTAFDWARGASIIVEAGGEGIRALVDEQGLGPKPGQLWRNPDLAATYRSIAEHGAAKGRWGWQPLAHQRLYPCDK